MTRARLIASHQGLATAWATEPAVTAILVDGRDRGLDPGITDTVVGDHARPGHPRAPRRVATVATRQDQRAARRGNGHAGRDRRSTCCRCEMDHIGYGQ